jgi:DNA-binding protein
VRAKLVLPWKVGAHYRKIVSISFYSSLYIAYGTVNNGSRYTMSTEPNVIFVGNKPPMNYVMAVITGFNMGNTSEVTLKARGRAISTAVDVAEIVRGRFFKDAKVHSIAIGTEQITPREGGNPRNVSTMEITLKKD